MQFAEPLHNIGSLVSETPFFAHVLGEIGEKRRIPLRFLVAAGG
jgi:hypothetical protein